MKITIESTPEVAVANGLPVRVWTGTTPRGTSLLVLVTRVAVPDDGHPDDLAELKRELTEPPTRHGVHGETPEVAAPRSCSVCLARDVQRPATHVACNASGFEWFECGEHGPTDNLTETTRVELVPIAEWFDRAERHIAAASPAAELERLRDRLSTIVDEAFGLQPVSTFDELLNILEREMNAQRTRLVNEGLQLERDLAAARMSLMHASGWLVKDFWSLYRAAVATLSGETPDSRGWLELQLARLHPAFETCEAERRGAPTRLTAAEREALTALHRWLHSPGGDCELIESAAAYHSQVEAESPRECTRLDAEEKCAHAPPLPTEIINAIVEHATRLASDPHVGGAFVRDAYSGALMGWHAKHEHPEQIALTGRLAAPPDEPKRSAWLTGFRLGAGLDPAADLGAKETPEAPKASTPGVCRVCGCTDDDCSQCVAKTGVACHWVEPDLCSACVGAPVEASPEPVELNDGLREYAREHLRYRAPELLTARDKTILAAYDAEETERAKSPDTWLGGDR